MCSQDGRLLAMGEKQSIEDIADAYMDEVKYRETIIHNTKQTKKEVVDET